MPAYISLDPLLPWFQVARPVPWAVEFGRSADLELEIGSGLGDFLVQRAGAHPHKNFVGLDLRWVPVRRALRKIALAGLGNVRVLKANAWTALERLFEEASLSAVYALFPCPWPKKTHVRHRLFSEAFFRLLNSRLKPAGEVLIVTDHRPYAEWMEAQCLGTGFRVRTAAMPPRFRTKYEKKWQALGQDSFYELRLVKITHFPVAAQEDAALKTHRVSHFNPERFFPAGCRGEITVEFKEVLYDPRALKGMARTLVSENRLLQHLWIEIVWKEGSWQVHPSRGSSFLPTAGIQLALDAVRDAVQRSALPATGHPARP